MIPAPAVPLLLELHQAVRIAAPQLPRRDRARLERAAAGVVLGVRFGEITLEPAAETDVLERLRKLLDIARSAPGIDWPTIVGVVNREG